MTGRTVDNKPSNTISVPIYQPLVLRPAAMTGFGTTATPLYTMFGGNYDCGYYSVAGGTTGYGWQTTLKFPAISDTRSLMQPNLYLCKILYTTSGDRGIADIRLKNNSTNVTTTLMTVDSWSPAGTIVRRMQCARITNISVGQPDVTYTLTVIVTGRNASATGNLFIWNKISILNCHINTNVL